MTAPKVNNELADWEAGQLVTWHCDAGPMEMVFIERVPPCWIALDSPTGLTGVVVHEREVSVR